MARVQGICSAEGCDRLATRRRGVCESHYEHWLNHGADRPRCSVKECSQAARHGGLCGTHWQRKSRLGNANAPVRIYNDLQARVESYIQRGVDCWTWTGSISPDTGYGRIAVDRKDRRAHRVVYELLVGPIPQGMTLDHECHNIAAALGECPGGVTCPHRRCVNPAHLVVRGIWDNTRRGNSFSARFAAATHCARGHAYSPSNTRWSQKRDGSWTRVCRICRREEAAKARDRKKPDRIRRNRPPLYGP